MNFRERELSWEEITLDWEDFTLSLGKGYQLDGEVRDIFASLEKLVARLCRPRWGYTLFPLEGADLSGIELMGCRLQTGRIITPFLKDAEWCALFVATAGAEFEALQRQVRQSGEIVEEFLLDAFGSAIAEATVREACKAMEQEVAQQDMGVSFPYSPGYCGWRVVDQQKLFSLLPEKPCGISLTPSSLMCPIKSVSGVVAVGQKVTKQKYGCEICRKKDCYKNRYRK